VREVGAVHASLGCGSAAAGLSCCRQPHLVLAVVVVNPQPPAETAASVAVGDGAVFGAESGFARSHLIARALLCALIARALDTHTGVFLLFGNVHIPE